MTGYIVELLHDREVCIVCGTQLTAAEAATEDGLCSKHRQDGGATEPGRYESVLQEIDLLVGVGEPDCDDRVVALATLMGSLQPGWETRDYTVDLDLMTAICDRYGLLH